MDPSERHIEMLSQLGLTLNEAKVFFAILRNGTSTAKAASKSSGVAREVVYRIIPQLQKKGLIEEVIATPKAFKTIPMNEACELLLERKEEENRELRKKLKATLQDFQITTEAEGENRIIVIPTGKNDSAWQKEWSNVQKSVDMIILFNKFSQWGQSYAEENMRSAVDRNVKIRVIVEKGIEEKLPASKAFILDIIAKLAQIKFKSAAKLPSTEMGVFDNKKLFLCIQNESNIRKMIWLYTDNPLIVEIANIYFENLWTRIEQDVEEKQKEK